MSTVTSPSGRKLSSTSRTEAAKSGVFSRTSAWNMRTPVVRRLRQDAAGAVAQRFCASAQRRGRAHVGGAEAQARRPHHAFSLREAQARQRQLVTPVDLREELTEPAHPRSG